LLHRQASHSNAADKKKGIGMSECKWVRLLSQELLAACVLALALGAAPAGVAQATAPTEDAKAKVRLNIGCGGTPTPGWLNVDNSLTVRLARWPALLRILVRSGLIGEDQLAFARIVVDRNIVWGDAVSRIPLCDTSASVVYSSHMLEHLDRTEARQFLAEAKRVLAPDGVLRIVVPDLLQCARHYVEESKDADAFMESTHLAEEKPRGPIALLKSLLVGPRQHLWMYDAASLIRLLQSAGFRDVGELPAGSTTIPDPGELNLAERAGGSVYVEARRP
jgi:predicted SAM-dependent methyltransferase